MIEIPKHIKNSHCRFESWHISGRPKCFVKKVFYDKQLNEEITEKEYETQRSGGRLRRKKND